MEEGRREREVAREKESIATITAFCNGTIFSVSFVNSERENLIVSFLQSFWRMAPRET